MLITAAGRRLLSPVLGKSRFQPVFEKLHAVSLAGMNFGEGNHPLLSGETFVMSYLRDQVFRTGRPVIIFDVGANIGVYARLALDTFGSRAVIYAFEPAAKTFRMLAENMDGRQNVKLYNVGFGNADGTATLFSAGEGSKLGSLYDTSRRLSRIGLALKEREQIALTTVDNFCEGEGVDRIDLLKLDVEGHELKILEGGRAMLDGGRVDALQFEFGAANVESRTFFRDFFDLLADRYVLYRVLQNGLHAVPEYRETYEVFKRATNYLGVRRELIGRAS